MGVYDVNGIFQSRLYDYSAESLRFAYDINKDVVFPDGEFLRVMSYNVGSWTAFGRKATTENQETWHTLQNLILSTEQADLLGIQEYYSAIGSYSVPAMIGQYYDNLYAVDWVSTKAGRAIASKYPLTNTREVNFQNQTGEIRSYLIGDVTVNEVTIKFITAHLALDNATIALQIQELLSAVNSFEYWIMTGDFNINFPNNQSDGYLALVKPFLDAGYHVANGSDFGFIPTFSTKNPGDDSDWRFLDNIMCSSNIDIINVYVNRQKITDHAGYSIDHLPLIAELNVRTEE